MKETIIGILTYDNIQLDIILNYIALFVNTLALYVLCSQLPPSKFPIAIRILWTPCLTGLLFIVQILLCLYIGCTGISIVWSAQAGYLWVMYGMTRTVKVDDETEQWTITNNNNSRNSSSSSPSSGNFVRHTTVILASLCSIALWIFYYCTTVAMISIAHACATVLGITLGVISLSLSPLRRPY
jgi:hypothetical protein